MTDNRPRWNEDRRGVRVHDAPNSPPPAGAQPGPTLPNCKPDFHTNGKHHLLCYEGSVQGMTLEAYEAMKDPRNAPPPRTVPHCRNLLQGTDYTVVHRDRWADAHVILEDLVALIRRDQRDDVPAHLSEFLALEQRATQLLESVDSDGGPLKRMGGRADTRQPVDYREGGMGAPHNDR